MCDINISTRRYPYVKLNQTKLHFLINNRTLMINDQYLFCTTKIYREKSGVKYFNHFLDVLGNCLRS